MVSATALPALGESETLVRNMQSHTTSSTADRYNNGSAPPPTSSGANFKQPGAIPTYPGKVRSVTNVNYWYHVLPFFRCALGEYIVSLFF